MKIIKLSHNQDPIAQKNKLVTSAAWRYQLQITVNLVFKDGGRLNVMDHGNSREIEKSASMLSVFS
ncbi:MAG: hypothetical protein AAGB12_03020 [Pseudomonadota bacterium]